MEPVMTRNDLDVTTRQALLDMDPAPVALDTAAKLRADESLSRILATEPSAPRAGDWARTRPGPVRKVVLIGAATIVTTAVAVSSQLVGDGNPAYATWTATPHKATPTHETVATDACRDSLLDSLDATPQIDPTGVTRHALHSASTVLAEQRGDWTLVVLADRGGLDASCVTQDDGGPLTNSFSAVAYRDSVHLGPRDVLVTNGGTGGSKDNLISVLIGFVGTDVTGVTIHTAEHGDVTATVTNGRVAAWWPGPTGVSVSDPRLGTAASTTISYSDGTTQTRQLDVGRIQR
jgi:hypothetical protein